MHLHLQHMHNKNDYIQSLPTLAEDVDPRGWGVGGRDRPQWHSHILHACMSCIDTCVPSCTLGSSAQSPHTKLLLASNQLQLPLEICGKLFQVDTNIRDAALLVGLKVILQVLGIWLHLAPHETKPFGHPERRASKRHVDIACHLIIHCCDLQGWRLVEAMRCIEQSLLFGGRERRLGLEERDDRRPVLRVDIGDDAAVQRNDVPERSERSRQSNDQWSIRSIHSWAVALRDLANLVELDGAC